MDQLIGFLNVAALATIMFAMGLKVKGTEILASARSGWLVGRGVLANYVLVPLVTLGLLQLFEAAPMIMVGFFLLAVCPGAPVGPPLTALAKGDLSAAVGMMVILAGLSALVSPALLTGLLGWVAPHSDLQVDYLAIVRVLLLVQMLPLAIGLAIHYKLVNVAKAITKPVGLLANVLLVLLIGMIITAHHETLTAIRLRAWIGMSLLLLASLGIGWLCGGRDSARRKAMAATTAPRNAAVALVIAARNFTDPAVMTAVVAYGLVSTLGALVFALVVRPRGT